MCEYIGSLKDAQRHIDIQLTDAEVTEAVKKMLNELEAVCAQTGLLPFCTFNKPPAVRIIQHFVSGFASVQIFSESVIIFWQGDDPFWNKKPS